MPYSTGEVYLADTNNLQFIVKSQEEWYCITYKLQRLNGISKKRQRCLVQIECKNLKKYWVMNGDI